MLFYVVGRYIMLHFNIIQRYYNSVVTYTDKTLTRSRYIVEDKIGIFKRTDGENFAGETVVSTFLSPFRFIFSRVLVRIYKL